MSRARGTVRLYVDRGAAGRAKSLLPRIEAVTAPHHVEIVEEAAPKLAAAGS